MTLVLFGTAVILGLIFKKSRICTFYIVSVMFLLSAFRYYDADLDNYRINYNSIMSVKSDWVRYRGYALFIRFWTRLGLDFKQYMIIFYSLVIVILLIAITLLTSKVNEVLSFYLIFSFALDVVQMKSFIAEAISLLGIAILIRTLSEDEIPKKKKRISIGIFIVLCCLATFMHFSALFYLMGGVLLIIIKNKNRFRKKIIGLSLAAAGMIYIGILPLIVKCAHALGILDDVHYLLHWVVRSTRLGFVVPIILVLLVVLSTFCITERESKENLQQRNINNYMITICFMIPLLVMNVGYNRLIRVYMILMYISFANRLRDGKATPKGIVGYLFFYISIGYAFWIDVYPVYESTLGALFSYNGIFR